MRRHQQHSGPVDGSAVDRCGEPGRVGRRPSESGGGAAPIDLFGTDVRARGRHDGGTIIIGDWQEANQFNPYYLGQVTEANVAVGTSGTACCTFTQRLPVQPGARGRADPDHRQRRRQGPGESGDAMTVTWKLRDGLKWSDGEPLTCDDFKYAWEWVLDKDNVGVVDGRLRGHHELRVRVRHRHDLALQEDLRGLHHPRDRAAAAPLPQEDPDQGPGQRRRASAPTRSPSLPVSGAVQVRVGHPAGRSCASRATTNYTNPRTGKPAHLDSLIFKWYGDADAMIAGFKAGEIDVATDLQDSDIPKVQDLGDQVVGDPGPAVRVPAPELVGQTRSTRPRRLGGCSRNAAVQDRGTGCPMADPAMREAIAYAIDKNEINTRLLGGNVQVANTNISPAAWFYADQPPATFDPEKAKQILDDGGWADRMATASVEKDGLKAKIELCTTTRQVRQDTLALIARWLKDVGIDSVINPVDAVGHLRRLQRGDRRHPVRALDAATSTSLSTRSARRSTRSATTSATTAASSSRTAPTTPRSSDTGRRRGPGRPSRTTWTSTSIKDAMAEFQKVYVEKTVEIPLYYRKNVELVGPKLGNFFANPTQAGSDLERRGLVRQASKPPAPHLDLHDGAPGSRAPRVRAASQRHARPTRPRVYRPRNPSAGPSGTRT